MENRAPIFATSMLRPLVLDIGGFALPLLIGVGAFAAGRSLYRLPKACRIVIVALAVGFVSVGCLVLARILPIEIEGIFYNHPLQ